MLVAVSKDCNRKMHPIAWAIVEKENRECWYFGSWKNFLRTLESTMGSDGQS